MPGKSTDDRAPDERGRYGREAGWWEAKPGAKMLHKFDFETNKAQACGGLIRVKEPGSRVEAPAPCGHVR
jgi:hypothetical protein